MTLVPTGPILGLDFGQDKVLERTPVDYCTLDQIKQYTYRIDLDLHGRNGDPDDEIKWARDRAESQVDGHCKTEFNYVKRMEWISGGGQPMVSMRFYPIVAVDSVRMYNVDYQTFFNYSGRELIIHNLHGLIEFPPLYITASPYRSAKGILHSWKFFPGRKNVQIIYTTGFLNGEVPSDFSDACAKWAAGLLYRDAEMRMSEGMSSRNISGVQENYGRFLQYGQALIEEAKQTMLRYKRVILV